MKNISTIVAFIFTLASFASAELTKKEQIQKAFDEGNIEKGMVMLQLAEPETFESLSDLFEAAEKQKIKVSKAERDLEIAQSVQNAIHRKIAKAVSEAEFQE